MNNKFDELTKSMAQSVTRRGALKKFGVGLVAAAAASLGIKSAFAAPRKQQGYCVVAPDFFPFYTGQCISPNTCQSGPSGTCNQSGPKGGPQINGNFCGFDVDTNRSCQF